jgi:hypothetical protein
MHAMTSADRGPGKLAQYLRGRKSRYSSPFVAYLRPIASIFVIFLSIYSIFEAMWKKKNRKGQSLASPWWCKMAAQNVNCNHDEDLYPIGPLQHMLTPQSRTCCIISGPTRQCPHSSLRAQLRTEIGDHCFFFKQKKKKKGLPTRSGVFII